jgi:transcription-repair coupling factor (superfamily II helicase)
MRTADWAKSLSNQPAIAPFVTALDQSAEWHTVAYEARPVLIAAAYHARPRKTLVVTASYERALAWQAKLQLCGVLPDMICQLPSGQSALFEDAAPEHIALSDRLGALRALAEDAPKIIIGSAGAVLERTLPKDILKEAFLEIRTGQEIQPQKFMDQLVNLGYEPQEPVRLPGQFSRRGGIIDVYATGRERPVA